MLVFAMGYLAVPGGHMLGRKDRNTRSFKAEMIDRKASHEARISDGLCSQRVKLRWCGRWGEGEEEGGEKKMAEEKCTYHPLDLNEK